MAAPIELVTFNASSGKFAVNSEAIAVLKRIPGPVAVVAVCGRARQGKSFLLNRLIGSFTAGSQSGFEVSPYQRPCTKGLWIYSTPILMPKAGPDGRRYHLVLMDCEGIDAYDQSQQYSTQIFSLAVMLSSMFVYNQMGGIDESSLERLSLVSELTKRIWEKSSTSSSPGSGEGQFSPSFLWLLRDFHLQVQDEGREMTPRDYLEETLQPMAGAQAHNRNQVRSSIKALFPDRDCFALVRPLTDEGGLARMDTLPLTSLRPEFQQGLKSLVDVIRVRARPKQYAGATSTGGMLAGLAEAFVAAINQGAVPVIANAWQGVVQGECFRAVEAASEKYRLAFNTAVVAEEGVLDLEHQKALAAGMKVFQELSMGDVEARAPYEAKFREAAAARFGELRARRLAEADAAISNLLTDATSKISALLREDDVLQQAKLAALQREVAEQLRRFEATAHGPTKTRRMQQLLQGVVLSGMEGLIRRAVEACKEAQAAAASLRAEAAHEAKERAAVQQEVRSTAARVAQLEGDLVAARKLSQEQAVQLQSKAVEAATASSELAGASTAARRLEGDLAEAGRREAGLRAELTQTSHRATQLTLELSEKTSSEQHTRAALVALQADVSRLRDDLSSAQQRADAAQAHSGSTQAQLEGQLAAVRGEAQRLQEQLERSNRQQLQDSQAQAGAAAEVARLSASLASRDAALADATGQVQRAEAELARMRVELARQLAEGEERGRRQGEQAGQDAAAMQIAGAAAQVQQLQGALGAAQAEAARQQAEQNTRLGQLGGEIERVQGRFRDAEAQVVQLRAQLAALSTQLEREQQEKAALAAAEAGERPGKRRRPDAPSFMDVDSDMACPSAPMMPEPSAPPMPTPPAAPAAPASAPPQSAAASRPSRANGRRAGAAASTPVAPAATPPASSPASSSRPALGSPMGPVAPAVPEVDPSNMSISQIKCWLTDSGYDNDVNDLNSGKAKKPEWVDCIRKRIAALSASQQA